MPESDQPVGIFLSGGLDSSFIAAFSSRLRSDITYFALGDQKNMDCDAVDTVVDALNLIDVLRVPLPELDALPELIKMVVFATESYNPSIVSNGLATYLLARAANSCFGMNFRTQVANGCVSVFHERRGQESLQLEIDVKSRAESDIRADIAARFTSGIEYPFSNSLRFSQIIAERFLFFRGDRLEIYSDDGFDLLDDIEHSQFPDIVYEYFGYQLSLTRPKKQGR